MNPAEQTFDQKFYTAAFNAIINYKNTDEVLSNNEKAVQTGKDFLSTTCPNYLKVLDTHEDQKSSVDRLVKIGRLIAATFKYEDVVSSSSEKDHEVNADRVKKTNAIFARLVEECTTMTKVLGKGAKMRIPKVRYGKTELQMPIVTLGCMRFQQSWNRGGKPVKAMSQVETECQENLIQIIKYAVSMGVNHIETAMGYGSSELQIGEALQTLFQGEMKREDLILQTKGGISKTTTPQSYRQSILNQLNRLKVDYVDLFSVHGMNNLEHIDWLYNNNLMDALKQLKKEGKIRNIGFSTHAPAEVISQLISKGDFDYLNLHHHFCGDYTASGDGMNGGNIDNVRLAQEKDMGIFIISPYDKGGRLYAPSNKLRDLTLPEFEPIEFGSMWLWHHNRMDTIAHSQPHTIVCGAARPSDLDQSICAAFNFHNNSEQVATNVDTVVVRLKQAMIEELGQNWVDSWHKGLPNCSNSEQGTQVGNIVWLSNVIRAYGLLDYAKDRYSVMESNLQKWDYQKTKEENVQCMGGTWPWMPGCAYDPTRVDCYTKELEGVVPTEHLQKVIEAMALVHKYCKKKDTVSATDENEEMKEKDDIISFEWQTAYDMRPWTAFPER